jgi:hypothetical protein
MIAGLDGYGGLAGSRGVLETLQCFPKCRLVTAFPAAGLREVFAWRLHGVCRYRVMIRDEYCDRLRIAARRP